MTYYHRYFLTHKLAKSDPFIMAVACLHLAAKCCDRPRRISDVVEHLYRWVWIDLDAWYGPGKVFRHRKPWVRGLKELLEAALVCEPSAAGVSAQQVSAVCAP